MTLRVILLNLLAQESHLTSLLSAEIQHKTNKGIQ